MDYLFKTTDLVKALTALGTLEAAGLSDPANMLGDPVLGPSGSVIARASKGRPAVSYVDPVGKPGTTAAVGDPAFWYLAIRADIKPSDIPFDPAAYGLLSCDPTENAAVLGVWA